MKEETAHKLDLPLPPEKPQAGECCERGCEKCVFDYYEDAYRRWQDKVARILGKHGIPFHPSGRDD